MNKKIEYKEGMLVIELGADAQVDSDKDGKPAVVGSLNAAVKVDAVEAVNEIIKDEVPAWLEAMIQAKKA